MSSVQYHATKNETSYHVGVDCHTGYQFNQRGPLERPSLKVPPQSWDGVN